MRIQNILVALLVTGWWCHYNPPAQDIYSSLDTPYHAGATLGYNDDFILEYEFEVGASLCVNKYILRVRRLDIVLYHNHYGAVIRWTLYEPGYGHWTEGVVPLWYNNKE